MTEKMEERALQKAAQCWCDPTTQDRVMDVDLAKVFAKALLDFHAQESKYLVQEIEHWMGQGIPTATETKEALADIEALKPHREIKQ